MNRRDAIALIVFLLLSAGPRPHRALGDVGGPSGREFYPPARTGTLPSVGTNEVSGIVRASVGDGYLWVHNDSSDRLPRVFLIHQSGLLIADVRVTGSTKADWEDIAVGPGPGGEATALYIADLGTNMVSRAVGSIWRVPEPLPDVGESGQVLDSEPAEEIRVRFPGGAARAPDTESIIVDPASGTIYVFPKSTTTRAHRVPPAPEADGVHLLESLASISLGDPLAGADVSPDGTALLLRTYNRAFLLTREPESAFESIFSGRPREVPAAVEPLAESITWDACGRDYFTISEGRGVPIYRVFAVRPHPFCEFELPSDSPLRIVRGDVVAQPTAEPLLAVDVSDLAEITALAAGENASGAVECLDRADVDDDGGITREDAETLLTALVRGRAIAAPYSDAGADTTTDPLECHREDVLELLAEDAAWAYWFEREAPPSGWQGETADVADWPIGAGGVGHGSESLGTVLEPDPTTRLLCGRAEIDIGDASRFDHVALDLDYAHGFVLFVNGVEAARRGVGTTGLETPPSLPAAHHPGGELEEILLCAGLFRDGRNAIAIEVHGRSVPDPRLFFRLRLRGFRASPGDPRVAPPEPPATPAVMRIVSDGPLVSGRAAVLRIVVDTDIALRGAAAVIRHDRLDLRVTDVRPAAWLRASALFESSTSSFSGSATFAAVVDPALGGRPIAPGVGVELFELVCEVRATQPGETRVTFSNRDGRATTSHRPGLEPTLATVAHGTISPELEELVVEIATSESRERFIRGDCNADGDVDLSDALCTLGWLFLERDDPACIAALDTNGLGGVELGDAIRTLNYLFQSAAPPGPPFPDCGKRGADEKLECERPTCE